MKSLTRKFFVVLIFGVLIFSGYKIYDSRITPEKHDEVELSQPPEPSAPDGAPPFLGAELVTSEEAQTRSAYHIPLPEGIAIEEVWMESKKTKTASNGNSSELPTKLSVAIQFENDIFLRIRPRNGQPDWDKLIEQDKDFQKISVNGIPGSGAEPGVEIYDDEAFFRRGSVSWWADNLLYTLYTDTLSLEDLLKVAETLQLEISLNN